MDEIIKACIELEKKYGAMPFDKALPHMREGWWGIAAEHNTTGDKILSHYLNWKSNQKDN